MSYAVSYANGVIDGGSSEALTDVDVDDDQDLVVRLFCHPFAESDVFALRGLGIGIAGSYIEQVGTVTQPLLPAFRTPPLSTFSPGKSWGAVELTARYHELDIDDEAFIGGVDSFADPAASAAKVSTAEVGINWYLNQNLKWVLNYGITRFDGGLASGDRDDERFLLTRFALGF